MKLSELKAGDKAMVEIEITAPGVHYTSFNLGGFGGWVIRNDNPWGDKIEVTNIIRKPVAPEAGQVWGYSTHRYRALFVDDRSVLFENIPSGHRSLYTREHFERYLTFVS